MTDVTVTDSGEQPDAPEVVDTSDTVVVTQPPATDDTATLVGMAATLGALTERLAAIESAVAASQESVAVAQATAEMAEADAAVAADIAADAAAVAEEAESEPEPEEPPAKTHWAQRSLSEWRGGRGGRR